MAVIYATIANGGTVSYDPGDINGDCITNLKDFAVMAAAWLNDIKSTGPLPK